MDKKLTELTSLMAVAKIISDPIPVDEEPG
ncbi:hypothetical protein JOE50_003488 [Bradyrhizobium japonicum]|nr:hypothetical protein [Bradyrhizobium japonicum]